MLALSEKSGLILLLPMLGRPGDHASNSALPAQTRACIKTDGQANGRRHARARGVKG